MHNLPARADEPAIACLVSSHGFGHAARVSAVIEALRTRLPRLRVEILTAVPAWFFEDSIASPVRVHGECVDPGLAQNSALEEDLEASAERLARELPFAPARVAALAERLRRLDLSLVLADIAPLGLAAATRAGLPSVLLENFTWSWILEALAEREARLALPAELLRPVFSTAGVRIQAEPFCEAASGALAVAPIARRPRRSRARVRRALGIPEGEAMVLVTMGGIPWDYGRLDALEQTRRGGPDRPWLVIPGAGRKRRTGRILTLPHRSEHYHPDLIGAADAVLGKLGYSTLAEVYRAGVPFGYVPRPGFPESPILEAWGREHLPHRRIEAEALASGRWLAAASELPGLGRRPCPPDRPDGAEQAAEAILEILLKGEARPGPRDRAGGRSRRRSG